MVLVYIITEDKIANGIEIFENKCYIILQ